MHILILAAATVSLSPIVDPEIGGIYSAIWADLQQNALIGNGNWRASLWYNASSGNSPDLHIQQLKCTKTGSGQRCAFVLFRDGGPATALGESAPDKLNCKAVFARENDGWSVVHTPPRRKGHSNTSMKCKILIS
jgi:hypothetical protein